MTDILNKEEKTFSYYKEFFLDLAEKSKEPLTERDIKKIVGSQLTLDELKTLKVLSIEEHFGYSDLCLYVSNIKGFTGVTCEEAYESLITCKKMIDEYEATYGSIKEREEKYYENSKH